MSTTRCVVVGDVVGSRGVPDRESFQTVLADALDRANADLGDALVAPFATLKGVDEVGAVLETVAGSYRAIRTLVEAIHPTQIRFAIVWGEIDVGVDSGDVASQDGPAFHRADELLGQIANAERYVGLDVGAGASDADTGGDADRSAGLDDAPTALARTVANQMELLCMWKAEWTERQAEVVKCYRDADSMTAVAERLDVTVQNVSKLLERAGADRVLEIEGDLEAALETLAAEVAA